MSLKLEQFNLWSAKLLDELTKKTLKTIKTEPMSDEEQNVPNESASEMRKRKLSNPIAAESWKMNRASISDPPQRQPSEFESTSSNQHQSSNWSNVLASAVSSRDPRLAKKTFLDGGLTTDDLIRSSDPVPESSLTTFQKSVLRKVQDIKQPNAFSANIPRAPRIPDKLDQQRSPAIISSHNPLFASQTTKENVRDSTNSQRYRNIPSKDRDSGTKSGDSDRISRAIQAPKEVQNSKTQRQEFTRAEHKTFEDKNVQTTKNTGGFSIIIDDLNSLTPEQRKALVEFKNVSRGIFSSTSISNRKLSF